MRKERLDIILGQTFFVVEMTRSGQTYLKVKKALRGKNFCSKKEFKEFMAALIFTPVEGLVPWLGG